MQDARHRSQEAKTCRLCTHMQGRARNRLGNVERNRKVKEGPCVFPFKYKRETHNACVETPKGKVCATSVNPKTGTMLTYGYCEEYGVKSPKRKSLKKTGTKKKGTLKLRTRREPVRPTWQDAGEWRSIGRSGEVGKEGEVFLVRREGGDQTVFALKQFKSNKSLAAVHKEARLQAQAATEGAAPRVVAVLETKKPAIVMERMDRTVKDVCKAQGNKLTAEQQWGILCAVERMDKSGIVHNDSNPLNLMIEGSGPNGKWKFVDFGMAKVARKGQENDNLTVGLRFIVTAARGIVSQGDCAPPEILLAALEQGTYRPSGVGPVPDCEPPELRTSSPRTKRKSSKKSSAKLRTSFRSSPVHESKTKKEMTSKKKLRLVTTFSSSDGGQRLNEKFIGVLAELQDVMTRKGGRDAAFRAKAYREAGDAIMTYDGDITPAVLEKWTKQKATRPRHIGPTIVSKLNEFQETGELKALKKEYARPELELTNIYGVGPSKAEELVRDHGIKTVEELREQPGLLNAVQKVGLQHYEDIMAKIPRAEIDEYNAEFKKIFAETTPPGSKFMIVGSYRRGKASSGDIEVIVTNEDGNSAAFKGFVDALISKGIITDVLTRGPKKCLALARLPGKRFRRVDFLWAPPKEYAFAVLYFTGSKIFNTVQRQRALDLGMTLNEHGLYKMVAGKKGARVEGDFPDERSIFRKLGMVYKEPKDRVDARSVELAEEALAEEHEEVKAASEALSAARQAVATARSVLAKRGPGSRGTLKKRPSAELGADASLAAFRSEGAGALQAMTEKELTALLRKANDAYYCDRKPIMTDNEFDIVREHTLAVHPDNEVALVGHAACKLEVQKNKVTLPYEMWSMDKIKPDTGALAKWKAEYKGPYVLSGKLDGVSGLYSTEGGVAKLYTRGNGIIGQDISHLVSYLQLPAVDPTAPVTIRGEFILAKEVFEKEFAKKFANPRNFVAGLVNQKKLEPKKLKHLEFVAYEVLTPAGLSPSQQMKAMEGMDVRVVRWMETPDVTNELLSELLVSWRQDYDYEIDGVICANDRVYPRTRGNPAHAFAFKMVLSDQLAEAKVLGVIWTASKHGFLKPRVQIEPVVLGGATISFATGFNAKFIEDNKIGVGALVTMVRSGDVIPHILGVVEPAAEPQMPSVPYVWNATHVDVMVKDKAQDAQVRESAITAFFSKLDTDGVGPGTVKKFIEVGLDSVPKILTASKKDFENVPGFKAKSVDRVWTGIRTAIDQTDLPTLMGATAIFGRGLGRKTFQKILDADPTVVDPGLSDVERLARLEKIKGLGKKGAQTIVERLPEFHAFTTAAGLEDKLKYTAEPVLDTGHPLFGKKYVLTGFRDKELVKKLTALGAVQAGSVSKDVAIVVSPDGEDSDTGKADQVRAIRKKNPEIELPILTPAEFKAKYGL